MKYIKLTQNKLALVDNENYQWLSQLKWSFAQGYARRKEKGRDIGMHVFLLNPPKGYQVDHINNNRLDNRLENLRICTNQQNCMNRRKRKNCESIYKGVAKTKYKTNWCSYIKFKGKMLWLGTFKEEIEAAKTYNIKAKELFGEYAKLNVF